MVAPRGRGLEEDTGKYSLLKAQFLFLLLWLLLPLASEIPQELPLKAFSSSPPQAPFVFP